MPCGINEQYVWELLPVADGILVFAYLHLDTQPYRGYELDPLNMDWENFLEPLDTIVYVGL